MSRTRGCVGGREEAFKDLKAEVCLVGLLRNYQFNVVVASKDNVPSLFPSAASPSVMAKVSHREEQQSRAKAHITFPLGLAFLMKSP